MKRLPVKGRLAKPPVPITASGLNLLIILPAAARLLNNIEREHQVRQRELSSDTRYPKPLDIIAGLWYLLHFHTVTRAHKQKFGIRKPRLHTICNGYCRVNMTTGSTA